MQAYIDTNKVAEIFYNDQYYPTREWVSIPKKDALQLARKYSVKIDNQQQSYNPDLFRLNKHFGFVADVDKETGFGGCSYQLLRHSADKYNISWIGSVKGSIESNHFLKKMRNTPLEEGAGIIWHDQPRDSWKSNLETRNLAILPFETTRIPNSWLNTINLFSGLMVPCKQNVQMMRDSGVNIPIEVIHWGVDSDLFYELDRKDDKIFTIGHMGALSIRKGTDLLIKAFKIAFPYEKDVRLLLKTSSLWYPFMDKDPRIQVHLSPWTHEELIENFYRKIDLFVFPTRGEGFGLTPLEAMATGVPSIVTNWSGPVEYMTSDVGWILDYKMTPAISFTKEIYKEDCGDWAEPNLNDLVFRLRYAYTHQDEVKQKGKQAAEYVRNQWLWKDKIATFHNALEKLL